MSMKHLPYQDESTGNEKVKSSQETNRMHLRRKHRRGGRI